MHSSLGIDYGTNSVRAVIVDCSNGAELGSTGFTRRPTTQANPLENSAHSPDLARVMKDLIAIKQRQNK
jgi:ribulose kinase